ncbi:hypothetical protein SAMN04489844_0649 [Nocardioides exalbidus]|uniref:Uncharacterized protein n=1 Tax=Nocardioides exalbidus TaxID=402596 RepID=A0A1H4KP02_9ACTN|nr:hypothetical protein [Nocardioides exalbidus]SEB60221.1 hypothetical protein SAMN04489844_0649 [Nocardioides exalbidus]
MTLADAVAAHPELKGSLPWLERMFAVDAAEADGDARGALQLIEEMLLGPDGRPFWRPERVRRLRQLVELGADVPTWAVRRWAVAQAAQVSPGRPREAMDLAIRTRGGRSTLWGIDDDARSKILDHDWVYRQLVLHDHGGLADFLRRVASPDLRGLTGDMTSWSTAPMGGYELWEEASNHIVWRDLATSLPVTTLNLGSASMMAIGEGAIGRIVESDDVRLFESAPLCVPIDVAQAVADRPFAWIDAINEACRGPYGEVMTELIAKLNHFDLLFDLSSRSRRYLIQPPDPDLRSDRVVSGGNGTEYDVALVLAAVAGELERDENELCSCGRQHDERRPLEPLVAAAMLEPDTVGRLASMLVDSDAAALRDLELLLPSPADVLCRRLRRGLADAA